MARIIDPLKAFGALRLAANRVKNDEIRRALDYAEINANDTPGCAAYWQTAYDSIAFTSPFIENAAVRRWFEQHGYTW